MKYTKLFLSFGRFLRRAGKILCFVLLISILCVIIFALSYPHKFIKIVATKTFHEFGLHDTNFNVEKINLLSLSAQGVKFSSADISANLDKAEIKLDDEKISLKNISFTQGTLKTSVDDISIRLALKENKFTLGNINANSVTFADFNIKNISIPASLKNITLNGISSDSINIPQIQITLDTLNGFSLSDLQNIDIQNLGLRNININTPQIKLGSLIYTANLATVTNNFSKMSAYDLKMKSPIFTVTAGSFDITTNQIPINNFAEVLDKMNPFNGKGNWQLKNLNAVSGDFILPAINGNGTFTVNNSNNISINGKATSIDKTINLNFAFNHSINVNKSVLRINNISYSFAGGILSTSDIVYPIGTETAVNFIIQAKDVGANEILEKLLGDKLTISGNISGSLPIETSTNFAKISVKNGTLYATKPGILKISPEFIPGNNPAVALVQNIVQNFHFSTLSFSVNTNKDGRIIVNMNIVGNNPDVENGRPVNMNVNLDGDILSLITQNMMLYKDPMKLLKQ